MLQLAEGRIKKIEMDVDDLKNKIYQCHSSWEKYIFKHEERALLIEEFNHWFQEATKLIEPAMDGIDALWEKLSFMEKLLLSINDNRSVILYKSEDSYSESRIEFLEEQIYLLKNFLDRTDPELKEYKRKY